MDLKVKDVADLLNVSETTIHHWLAEGKIPAYQLNQQYCFSRGEIQNWVMTQRADSPHNSHFVTTVDNAETGLLEEEGVASSGGNKQFSLYRALHKGNVLFDVTGRTKEEIIHNAMEEIASTLDLDREMLFELLWDRERLQPTALNNGIGVPHTRDFLLKAQDAIFIAFPNEPVEYGALDGQPVHTLFFLFASEDKRHLHLLAKIALFCSQPATVDFLKQHPSKLAFLEYIKAWEASIPKR